MGTIFNMNSSRSGATTRSRVRNDFTGFQKQMNYSEMNYNKKTNLLYEECHNRNFSAKQNPYLSQSDYLRYRKYQQSLCPSGCNILPFNKGDLVANLVTIMDMSNIVTLCATTSDTAGANGQNLGWGQPNGIPTYLDPSNAQNIWSSYWVDPFSNITGNNLCNALIYTSHMKLNPLLFPTKAANTVFPTFQGDFFTAINNNIFDPSNIPVTNDASANFGASIQWAPNGTMFAVAAIGDTNKSGTVYIFGSDSHGTIKIDTSFNAPNLDSVPGDNFGIVMSWSYDSSKLAVRASTSYSGSPQVYLYDAVNHFSTDPITLFDDPSYNYNTYDPSEGTQFGSSISWHPTGTVLAIGAPGADVYDISGNNNGNDISGNGVVYLFDPKNGVILDIIDDVVQPGASLGYEVAWAPNINEFKLAVGVPYADYHYPNPRVPPIPKNGAVYLYAIDPTTWAPTQDRNVPTSNTGTNTSAYIITTPFVNNENEYFGHEIKWSNNSQYIAIGGYYLDSNSTNNYFSIFNRNGYVLTNYNIPVTNPSFAIRSFFWSNNFNSPTLAVTTQPGTGSTLDCKIYFYDVHGKLKQTLDTPDRFAGVNHFGISLDWSKNGNMMAVSARAALNAGVTFVYTYTADSSGNPVLTSNPTYILDEIETNNTKYGRVLSWAPNSLALLVGNYNGNPHRSGDIYVYH